MSKYKICPELLSGMLSSNAEIFCDIKMTLDNFEGILERKTLNYAQYDRLANMLLCLKDKCAKYNQCAGKKS